MTLLLDKSAAETYEFAFSDDSFINLANFAHGNFGLNLPLAKKPLVYSRLSKRVRTLKFASVDDYILNLLDQKHANEVEALVSLLTTNVTHFFREAHHFEHFRKHAIPKIAEKIKNKKRVRLWSAGCSSGQEAYSMAIALLEALPEAGNADVKILATDLDSRMVAIGKAGRYPREQFKASSPHTMEKYFSKLENGLELEAKSELKNLVSFAELNLVGDWPFSGGFDVIFCRNVAIYFDAATQAKLWGRFSDLLETSGVLYLGHSERLDDVSINHFSPTGVTSYSRL